MRHLDVDDRPALLLVSSDPTCLEPLEALLSHGGALARARCAREALDRLRRGGVTLVLVDVRCEALDEVELARAVSALPASCRAPLLVLASCPGDLQHLGSPAVERGCDCLGLAGRQRELARMIVRGHGNKDIARRLGLSVWTVKNHMKRLLRHVGVSSRAHLARRVVGA